MGRINKLFKTNSFIFGISVGLITPVGIYFVLSFAVKYLSEWITRGIPLIQFHNVILVSVFLNMVIFIPYLQKPQYDKTGRGVMIITFVLTAIYFVWRFKNMLG